MAVEFNRYGNYNYNFKINNQENQKRAQAPQQEEVKETEQQASAFKGLENETDLLTKTAQNLYGVKISKFTSQDKEIADETNAILANLGFNYRVTPNQVASVANGLQTVVIPGMQLAEAAAVEAHIQNPDGPFADLFA